jgi:hypothetical protein
MNKYYKPLEKDFVEDLECEVYDEESNNWATHTLDSNSRTAFLPLLKIGDIRVKYLHSGDFNKVGYTIEKILLSQQEVILNISYTGKETIGKEDLYNEEDLNILHNHIKVGVFKPYSPNDNVVIKGKKHTVKNLTELRKILK